MRRANGRKRFRTKFTQNQKEKMLELAERIGWKQQKRDEELISEFCSKIGVRNRVFKVWLHNNNKNSRRATADILPECLIQKIFSYLSFKKAAKMSILSKTWLQAWSTLPNLEFKVDYAKGNTKMLDDIMERYRDRKIPIEKFKLSDNSVSSEVFPLIDKWLDIALENGVKDIFLKSPSYPLPIFTILAGKSLRELVLECCTLMSVSLSNGVVYYNSLRKLSLYLVRLDENMLQTLLNSCPLIVSLILKYCKGLEKIKSDSLKVLKIRYCNEIGEIEAPNLVSLEYTGYHIPKLKIARKSSQLKHSKIILTRSNNLNAAWFSKLRTFLSNSTSWSQLSLYFSRCSEINMTDLQLHYSGSDLQMDHRGSTPQVDVLKVIILSQNEVYCPTFVDALLWSCHPKRLKLHSSSTEMITCFMSQLKEVESFEGKIIHWNSEMGIWQ